MVINGRKYLDFKKLTSPTRQFDLPDRENPTDISIGHQFYLVIKIPDNTTYPPDENASIYRLPEIVMA